MPNETLRDYGARLARLLSRRADPVELARRHDAFAAARVGTREAATSPWNNRAAPTEAQQRAGNYKLGTAHWQGFRLKVENPAHTFREGVDPGGVPWRSLMQADYGYFEGTRGADGDGVDVFLGPFPESTSAWVINQTDEAGQFDEHKVMGGFVDERSAVDAYRLSYTPGWSRYGPPVRLSIDQLRWWLKFGDTSRALTPEQVPPEHDMTDINDQTPPLSRVLWDSAAQPASGQNLATVLYGIRSHDAREGLLMDAMTMADLTEGVELVRLDALVTMAGKLKPKMEALQRIMEAAGTDVTPTAMQITEPMRRYGGVHVAVLYELSDGQTVTVWFHNPDSTPAKLTPADDLVSWKWQLNKKDITIVVAPESGQDLNLREVARRVMRLASKNSAAFKKANARRAEALAEVNGLRAELAQKQEVLSGLQAEIEVEKVAASDRAALAATPAWKRRGFDPTTPDGYLAVMWGGKEAQLAWQDQLDSLFQERLIAVRNALRDLGWEGDRFAPLMKIVEAGAGGVAYMLSTDYTQVGAGSNVVGVVYSVRRREVVAGSSGFDVPATVTDDLSQTPEAIAAELNAAVREERAVTPPAPMDFVQWEDALTRLVEERMEADRGDAQGMLEAQDLMNRGILARLHAEGVSPEDAYTKLWGEEGAAPPVDVTPPQPASDPEPVAPVDPVAEEVPADETFTSIEPEALALLRENPKAYATAELIEREATSMGGAVSWVTTAREPDALTLDSVSGGSKDKEIREIFQTTANDWRAGYAMVDAYGHTQLAQDIRASFIAFGQKDYNSKKPQSMFLGSALDILIEDYEKQVLGGVRLNKLNAGQDALKGAATVFKKIIDTAWGKGSFDFLKFLNSRDSLKREYPDEKKPAWAKSAKLDDVSSGGPLRDPFPSRGVLDALFELDGAKFVRGDISYRGTALGSVTINGTGEAFFVDEQGQPYVPWVNSDTAPDEYESFREEAVDKGLLGWTTDPASVLIAMLDYTIRDPINEKLDPRDDGADAWVAPNAIIDRGNEHWKRTVWDLSMGSPGAKTAILGTLHNAGRKLVVKLVRKNTNRADWYVVIHEQGKAKVKDSIPFPAINSLLKSLVVAEYVIGYLNADGDKGWKISPPGVEDIGDRNPILVQAQQVRQELVKLGYEPAEGGVPLLLLKRDGATHSVKWEYQGPEDAPTSFTFSVTKFVNGTMVDELLDFMGMSGSTPENSAIKLDSYVRGMASQAESAEVAFLREVVGGAHDALALGELLARIESNVRKLEADGSLTGEADAIAGEAITRWAQLDEKANG